MKEIVTDELKARICDLFEQHDKIVEEQDEYIEQLRERNKYLQSENTRLKADIRGYCKACKHLPKDFDGLMQEPCSSCTKILKRNFEWRGLE